MGYTAANGKWMDVEDVNLNPTTGTSITADAVSNILELGDRCSLRLTQVVSANAATSLDTTIQGSQDRSNWFTLGTMAQVTTPATERKSFPTARYVRASYNHTGAGAIVVTLSGEVA